MEKKDFVALIILDGYGIAEKSDSNSVTLAKKPYLDYLFSEYPNSFLSASGLAVGLPEGQMGNSEVGHLNLGAGRVVYQSLSRINNAIKDHSLFENEAYLAAINHVKKNNSKLHLLGLVSDGGVHSHTSHFKALFDLAKLHGIQDQTFLHAFLDGRDTPPTSGINYLKSLLDYHLKLATLSGRYYAMDRDSNWDRIQISYDTLLYGKNFINNDPLEEIKKSYENGVTDEFIVPFTVNKDGLIEDNDAVIFVNFRPDRAIRISTALSNIDGVKEYYVPGKPTFTGKKLNNLLFVSTMSYANSVKGLVAFPIISMNNLFGDVISRNNLKQLRIAETEKYAHVTYFFDGGIDKDIPLSNRLLIPSPKVKTYDLKPEMSAYLVAEKAKEEILSNNYATMILNFANPDMVGHTGNLKATIKAIEAVDDCVKTVVEAILSINGVAIIIADHGNAEKMIDDDGSIHTAHTTNLVPVLITMKDLRIQNGSLCDIAPTMLELLKLNKPFEMTGKSLIHEK